MIQLAGRLSRVEGSPVASSRTALSVRNGRVLNRVAVTKSSRIEGTDQCAEVYPRDGAVGDHADHDADLRRSAMSPSRVGDPDGALRCSRVNRSYKSQSSIAESPPLTRAVVTVLGTAVHEQLARFENIRISRDRIVGWHGRSTRRLVIITRRHDQATEPDWGPGRGPAPERHPARARVGQRRDRTVHTGDFGLVALEAMSVSTPVVAFDVGNLPALIGEDAAAEWAPRPGSRGEDGL